MGGSSFAPLPAVPSGSLALKEDKSAKGAASGYAPLDSGSLVPVANLPAASATQAGAMSIAHFNKVDAAALASFQALATYLLPDVANAFDPTVAPGLAGRAGAIVGTADQTKCWMHGTPVTNPTTPDTNWALIS